MMHPIVRPFFALVLAAVSCLMAIALGSIPAPSHATPINLGAIPAPLLSYVQSNFEEAEASLGAEGKVKNAPQRFVALLQGEQVVPPTATSATGAAGAVLAGNRLVVRGDFGTLSSQLRDYATDPVAPPNPNITSAVHIHRGAPNQNGPFQYALTVTLGGDRLGGRLAGEFTLTAEQLQALAAGNLYVDVHTQQNRGGELRGVLRPLG
jgi:hypothetical protein